MKPIVLLRFLGAAACVSFASCESTWPYGASDTESRRGSGYSLDNPPSSQSRYLQGPAGTTTTAPGASTTTTETVETTTTNPPADAPPTTTTTTTETTTTAPPVPPAPTSSPASYGSPVPGRKGFVFPPGSEQKAENMVDVRDFTPGQKVRDPRTGKVFLVP
ncbi:MAG TPA: hypothetical protein VLE43_08815 [Candidatus Saccharimonadia bacterium]|nr:hypothetical protein [Candidatus Saccharimonadia bacterium]